MTENLDSVANQCTYPRAINLWTASWIPDSEIPTWSNGKYY